jgi:hypothetical protein
MYEKVTQPETTLIDMLSSLVLNCLASLRQETFISYANLIIDLH